jgi:hypothetical protein
MNEIHDPRFVELQRLRFALTRAAKHLDEFETRLKPSGAAGIRLRDLMASESSFANYVAARERSALIGAAVGDFAPQFRPTRLLGL